MNRVGYISIIRTFILCSFCSRCRIHLCVPVAWDFPRIGCSHLRFSSNWMQSPEIFLELDPVAWDFPRTGCSRLRFWWQGPITGYEPWFPCPRNQRYVYPYPYFANYHYHYQVCRIFRQNVPVTKKKTSKRSSLFYPNVERPFRTLSDTNVTSSRVPIYTLCATDPPTIRCRRGLAQSHYHRLDQFRPTWLSVPSWKRVTRLLRRPLFRWKSLPRLLTSLLFHWHPGVLRPSHPLKLSSRIAFLVPLYWSSIARLLRYTRLHKLPSRRRDLPLLA